MAKKYLNPVILVPWFDTDGMKQRSYLKFTGECDMRLLVKAVQGFITENFGSVSRDYVRALIKANLRVLKKSSAHKEQVLASDELIENWIQGLQDAEDQDEGHPGTEGGSASPAEVRVPDVRSGSEDTGTT